MKCMICQCDVISFKHPKTGMLFHECSHCKAIFKDISHFPTKEDEVKRYEEHHNILSNKGYVNFLQGFIDSAIAPYIHEGQILDFGSGPTAVLAHLLNKMGYRVDCYDPFFNPKFDDKNVYDMVVATEVIEHLHDPLKQFRWIDQHIKKQGYFSCMTLLYPLDREKFFEWFYLRDQTHVVFYHSKTYEYLAKLFNWHLIKDDGYRIVVFQKKL